MIIVILLLSAILITLLGAWPIIGFLLLIIIGLNIVCWPIYWIFRKVKKDFTEREKLKEYKETEDAAFKIFNEEIRENKMRE